MKQLPVLSPQWATNANFPAGAQPWSATPTRVAPSGGVAAAGFAPAEQPPAQFMNYQLGKTADGVADAAAVATHAAMRDWAATAYSLAGNNGTRLVLARQDVATYGYTPSEKQRYPEVYGPDTTDSDWVKRTISADAKSWSNQGKVTGTGFASGLSFAAGTGTVEAGAAQELFMSNGAVAVSSSNGGTSWATNNNFTHLNTLGFHYAAGAGFYFACDTDGQIKKSASFTTGATNVTIPGVTTFNSIASGNYAEFADDGGANIVMICRENGNAYFSAYRSGDSGVTWAKMVDLTGTFANVVYNAAHGKFVMLDSAGVIWASTDGALFTGIATSVVPAQGRRLLAALGHVVAAVINPAGYQGIAYSLDLGANWNVWKFSIIGPPNQLRAGNGRLYALLSNTIWQSGQITAPAPDLHI